MAASAFTVHVINPRHKTQAKKKRAKKATKVTTTTTKVIRKETKAGAPGKKKNPMAKRRKKATRRPAKRGAATTRKITRRRRNPIANPAPRKVAKRRRSNPSSRGGLGAIMSEVNSGVPRLLGKLAAAWAVRRYSNQAGGMFGQAHTSPTAGEGWSLPQYAIAAAVAMWGPKLFGRFIPSTDFRRGVVDLILEKFVWTEGIARSPWAVAQFGTGDVGYNAATGQSYVQQGSRWNAMQGLVEQTPLDGLVEQTPLDGNLDYQYGHLMDPASTSNGLQRSGKWHGSGYTNQYHAAFTHG